MSLIIVLILIVIIVIVNLLALDEYIPYIAIHSFFDELDYVLILIVTGIRQSYK